jgi:hypothetical protein
MARSMRNLRPRVPGPPKSRGLRKANTAKRAGNDKPAAFPRASAADLSGIEIGGFAESVKGLCDASSTQTSPPFLFDRLRRI